VVRVRGVRRPCTLGPLQAAMKEGRRRAGCGGCGGAAAGCGGCVGAAGSKDEWEGG